MARRAYWNGPKGTARRKRTKLLKDLKLLARAIRWIRTRLEARLRIQNMSPEQRNRLRVVALASWNARGRYKRRQKSLESAFRSALRSGPRSKQLNLRSLVKATKNVSRAFHGRVHSKLRRKLRRYFEKAFSAGSRSQRAKELIGCTIPQLRAHLERQFKPGMTWGNHSFRGWHIDHIRPLASFDLHDPAQQRIAFHFTNLQPLWMKENMTKHDSFQPAG
jgi:hypothetical protein